jgi:hypothetical protein
MPKNSWLPTWGAEGTFRLGEQVTAGPKDPVRTRGGSAHDAHLGQREALQRRWGSAPQS